MLILLDKIIYHLLRYIRNKLYKWNKNKFKFKEAIFWGRAIDVWERYSKVVEEIKKDCHLKPLYILDVGSGGEGIGSFLRYTTISSDCRVVCLDISLSRLATARREKPILGLVLGNGAKLPFKDNTFDVVVCIDVLEHMAQDIRRACMYELKRVAKRKVILHLPIDSQDGRFRGSQADFEFQVRHMELFKCKDVRTQEHLESGPVTVKEIENVFPGIRIEGSQNKEIWMKYMLLQRRPILGFLAGLLFWLKWQKSGYNQPPYHACFAIYNKNE